MDLINDHSPFVSSNIFSVLIQWQSNLKVCGHEMLRVSCIKTSTSNFAGCIWLDTKSLFALIIVASLEQCVRTPQNPQTSSLPIDPLNINGSPLKLVCKGECFSLAIKKHPPLFAPQSEARNSIYHKKGVAQFNVIKGCIRVITEMALTYSKSSCYSLHTYKNSNISMP